MAAPTAPGTAPQTGENEPARPLLQILSGDPTPEEIAALVTVLASLGGGEQAPARQTPAWQAHHRRVRATLPHGPGGWRSSGLPR